MTEQNGNREEKLLADTPSISASLVEWKMYIENATIEQLKALRNRLRGIEYSIKITRKLVDDTREEQ